jgi:Fe-S-cluster-containing dehydrogenase component
MRYAMVIDMKACVGCMNCVVACKTENSVPPRLRRDWVTETERGDYPDTRLELRSERCNHCENPPCVPVCPTGASKKRKDGIVVVEKDECIACGACIEACPYGARFLHPDGYVGKCTYCLHLVEQGLEPACVASCPVSCMYFGDLDDPASRVSELLRTRSHHVLKPEAGTGPHGYYLT